MSIRKMTFSLASLILMMALIAVPVMAQEDLVLEISGTVATAAALDADADERFLVIAADATPDYVDAAVDTAENFPDLEERFLVGTTIALLAPAGDGLDGQDISATNPAVMAKDVVISEIMWGLNTNAADFDNRDNLQWIEFYNTTLASSAKGAIDTTATPAVMTEWILYFVDTHDKIPVPAEADVDPDGDGAAAAITVKNVVSLNLIDADGNTDDDADEQYVLVDMVSNLAGGGWTVVTADGSKGQNGAHKQNDTDATAAVDIVSMYRNINYANVEKDFEKDKEADNRAEQLKAIPDGGAAGSWARSTRAFDNNLVGTPGSRHFRGAVAPLTASPVTRTKVIVNEIGNSSVAGQDWVEIRNVSGDAYNLKNHHLSYVKKAEAPPAKAADGETSLVNFKDEDVWIPKDGILLVLASDPDNGNHPIAGGINIKDAGITWDATSKAYDIEDDTDRIPNGSHSLYYIDAANTAGFELPDDDTLIILRSAHDKLGTDSNLLDVNGGLSITDRSATHATSLWPLKKTAAAHKMFIEGIDNNRKFPSGGVYVRKTADGGTGEKHWGKAAYTGIGYKRTAAAADVNGGTPGYANDAASEFAGKATKADGTANDDYKAAPVTISEIMYATGRNLPQWIELYNSSMTQGVNVKNWQLKLENADDVTIRTPAVTVTFADTDKVIPPNQTILIVSTNGAHSNATNGDDFPESRVINLWRDGLTDRDDLEIDEGTNQRTFTFLSETAFKVTLMNKDDEVVDEAGNLDADGEAMWALPTTEEGRSSIIRRYDEGDARDGTTPVWAGEGVLEAATGMQGMSGDAGWVFASESPLGLAQANTYYGNRSDMGTPGYRAGGPLPVSLSKFRPERLETGEIVVRWVTESELNNAGFNILRSDARDGEFTKVSTALIAGQGTTSERTAYEWKDTSAKPNVTYYYQIQDVSLDGDVQTLRTSRLKGDISADGKLTTTWGELKALQ